MKVNEYFAPDIEVLYLSVEQGFLISNLEDIDDENPDQEW